MSNLSKEDLNFILCMLDRQVVFLLKDNNRLDNEVVRNHKIYSFSSDIIDADLAILDAFDRGVVAVSEVRDRVKLAIEGFSDE